MAPPRWQSSTRGGSLLELIMATASKPHSAHRGTARQGNTIDARLGCCSRRRRRQPRNTETKRCLTEAETGLVTPFGVDLSASSMLASMKARKDDAPIRRRSPSAGILLLANTPFTVKLSGESITDCRTIGSAGMHMNERALIELELGCSSNEAVAMDLTAPFSIEYRLMLNRYFTRSLQRDRQPLHEQKRDVFNGRRRPRTNDLLSARETLFKCIYPIARRYFGYEVAEVTRLDYQVCRLSYLSNKFLAGIAFEGSFDMMHAMYHSVRTRSYEVEIDASGLVSNVLHHVPSHEVKPDRLIAQRRHDTRGAHLPNSGATPRRQHYSAWRKTLFRAHRALCRLRLSPLRSDP